MPPPTPVPRITPNTTPMPAAAPSVASDSAKQLASLAMATGRPSARARSAPSGRPFSQVEFALRTSPVCGDSEPGMPIPIDEAGPQPASASPTSEAIAASVAS